MLQGDFTTYASAACQGTNRTLKAPFVNNTISPSLLSPAAVKISELLPAPVNNCGLAYYGAIVHLNGFQVPVRFDYQVSDKHSLFVRYQITNSQQEVPYSLSHNLLDESATGLDAQAQEFTLGDTYVIGPNMVNSLRASATRITGKTRSALRLATTRWASICTATRRTSFTSPLSGDSRWAAPDSAPAVITRPSDSTTISAWCMDRISLSLAGLRVAMSFGSATTRLARGSLYSATATGLGLSDFLLGQVSSLRQSRDVEPTNMRENFFSLYAQDTWKINPKLTLNYGVSWEPWLAASYPHRDTADFSVAAFYAGQRSTVFPTAPPGFTFPGDPGFPGGTSGINSHWNNFDPRIGIAWDPKGDGKTAIRLGGGILRDYLANAA